MALLYYLKELKNIVKIVKFLIKYHKWISIIFLLFILMFASSGIILNHRELLAGIDVNRNILPEEYRYNNWNNAAVKGELKISRDSILIYGNIGIWLTNSLFTNFSDFNNGLPKGIDNRKICSMYKTKQNTILAGTFFGLYQFNSFNKKWELVHIPVSEKRIVDIIQANGSIHILTRSHLLETTDLSNFKIFELPAPENDQNKVSLFKTLWVIHSGEIYGKLGKILIDFIGIIFMFLTITGFLFFINKTILKKKKIPDTKKKKLISSNLWNIKWHNKVGWITIVFLIVTASTGIFLRPPFLIFIANAQVNKIPFSELDTQNHWFDKLRKIIYDDNLERYIVATSDGIFYSDDNFHSSLKRYMVQPPISVMGVNTFEFINSDNILVGSFEGLFLWQPNSGQIIDWITKEPYNPYQRGISPIGEYLITGTVRDNTNNIIFFDYDRGASYIRYGQQFPKMPAIIKNQPISLWNVALEFHTGRIFGSILGSFYILIVPLIGLIILFILISGFWVWFKQNRKKQKAGNL